MGKSAQIMLNVVFCFIAIYYYHWWQFNIIWYPVYVSMGNNLCMYNVYLWESFFGVCTSQILTSQICDSKTSKYIEFTFCFYTNQYFHHPFCFDTTDNSSHFMWAVFKLIIVIVMKLWTSSSTHGWIMNLFFDLTDSKHDIRWYFI